MSPPLNRINSDERLPAQADVVVIGGGVIGVSAAYHLAKKGLSVALVEKGHGQEMKDCARGKRLPGFVTRARAAVLERASGME